MLATLLEVVAVASLMVDVSKEFGLLEDVAAVELCTLEDDKMEVDGLRVVAVVDVATTEDEVSANKILLLIDCWREGIMLDDPCITVVVVTTFSRNMMHSKTENKFVDHIMESIHSWFENSIACKALPIFS